jgi:Ca-activated chloride channel family protein
MASPMLVRQTVLGLGSEYLSAVPLRPWEFFNYYNWDYPQVAEGILGVTTELVEGAEPGTFSMQVGINSAEMLPADRPPMNITFVLDTSGSMGSYYRMDHLKAVCSAISASLKDGDIVSMVTWDTNNTVMLANHTVSGPSDATLAGMIASLSANGGTDLNAGLLAGYNQAEQAYDPGRVNRIVLISDGYANVGVTQLDLIGSNAELGEGDGIYMVGVGVGISQYNDDLMDAVTDAGKGASVYIASVSDAWDRFNARFSNTMMVAARNVQVRMDLPPGFERSSALILRRSSPSTSPRTTRWCSTNRSRPAPPISPRTATSSPSSRPGKM